MSYVERHGKGWRVRWKGPPGSAPEWPSRSGFATKRAAKTYGDDQEAAIRAGSYIDPHLSETRFGAWWDTWFAVQDLRPNTRQAYNQQYRKHIAPRWAQVPLAAIRGIDVEAWLKTLREDAGLSASTRNIITSAMSGAFDSAVFNRMIPSSPMPPKQPGRRKSGGKPAREGVVIPLGVVEQILARLESDADRLIVMIALMTGMRWSEIAGMRLADLHLTGPHEGEPARGYYRIDPANGALHQDEHARPYLGPPKSGSSSALAPGYKPGRIIDLPPLLVLILLAYLETLPKTRDGLLFPNRYGGPRRYEAFNVGRWRPAVDGQAAYVSPKGRSVREAVPAIWPGLQIHDLKHTHKAILNDLRVHPVMQDYRLGHVTPGAPGIYSHPTGQMRAELVDGLERFLRGWVEAGLGAAWQGWRRPRPSPISLPPARSKGSGDNALF